MDTERSLERYQIRMRLLRHCLFNGVVSNDPKFQPTAAARSLRALTPSNITVIGPFSRPVHLRICTSKETPKSIIGVLHQRRLIAGTNRIHYSVYHSSSQRAPLDPDTCLSDYSVGDLSVLQIRCSLLGGMNTGPYSASTAPDCRFTKSSGKFQAQRPEIWKPLKSQEKYQCAVCPDNPAFESRRITRHEQSTRHQTNLKRWDKDKGRPHPPLSTSTNHHLNVPVSEVLTTVIEEWQEDVAAGQNPYMQATRRSPSPSEMEVDFEAFSGDTSLQVPFSQQQCEQIGSQLLDFMQNDGESSSESDGPPESESEQDDIASPLDQLRAGTVKNVLRPRKVGGEPHRRSLWYPWPDRETCVLDILRHIPRCAFSRKQNEAIHWAMVALNVENLPSSRVMDTIDSELQSLCGIRTIRHEGKLGHVYYTNDLSGIIAQEMSNPQVRRDLHFFPEDSGPLLAEAWQAKRWLEQLDPELTTPMIRIHNQDFYLQEPLMLRDGRFAIPTRWFIRNGQHVGKCHLMEQSGAGWVVDSKLVDIESTKLSLALPSLVDTFRVMGKPDPRHVIGIRDDSGGIAPWEHSRSDLVNEWRIRANGKRVVAFPMWLYCDDTSGNSSKKWNKHNSFLFTPAGLPRRRVHHESNIHFLCTSNIAPPLEMLDGIVEQLIECQEQGILARDSTLNEDVLVIPSVLAMVGDNPMQSEFSCHIGFNGKFFCRVCEVSGNIDTTENDEIPGAPPVRLTQDDDDNDVNVDGDAERADAEPHCAGEDQDKEADVTMGKPRDEEANGEKAAPTKGGAKKGVGKAGGKKVTRPETLAETETRYDNFMKAGTLRTPARTREELQAQFLKASQLRCKTASVNMRTASGIKDTFQAFFSEKLFAATTRKGRTKEAKQAEVAELLASFPEHTTSPVWRIRDLDPHQDTPVEILHVILLGFVKYFWRDAVHRCKKKQEVLIARLAGLDTSGLGIPPVTAETLVRYAGSLTGRDFRVIAQVAPFILNGLMPPENIRVWVALSNLVALVWQPVVRDVDIHVNRVDAAINHFLDVVCLLNLGWFNKPKFHVILHLPVHIRRFGPAILFATEGFESFNAIIRCCSIHSNRHAPSKDIGVAMAKGNRVRHLLSGGHFWLKTEEGSVEWVSRGSGPDSILFKNNFGSRFLGMEDSGFLSDAVEAGSCERIGDITSFAQSKSFTAISSTIIDGILVREDFDIRLPRAILLSNGDRCSLQNWVVWESPDEVRVGRVVEIVQVVGSRASCRGRGDWVLVQEAELGEAHPGYGFPRLTLRDYHYQLFDIAAMKCTVNVQHDCDRMGCTIQRVRQTFEERELGQTKKDVVVHANGPHFVLNLGQMRDASVLDSFRIPPERLNRSNVIHTAVAKYKQVASTQNPAPPPPSSTPCPSTTTCKGRKSRSKSSSTRKPRKTRPPVPDTQVTGASSTTNHQHTPPSLSNAQLPVSRPRPIPRPRPPLPAQEDRSFERDMTALTQAVPISDTFQTHRPHYGQYSYLANTAS
ncbi:hypothetical protein V5O48_006915 [Marasmius crinis-equi]|uniref:Uncharacterized protein n=1 Tax=Marasmius crinis-equi TaxID=585013 RepID=A0ABR3FI46_9AGAR